MRWMMAEQTPETMDQPDDIRTPDGQRRDGRPTGGDRDDRDLGSGTPHEQAPTVAPEEEGGSPSTEHAPGADL
jgi:hypothetical protein